MLCKINLLPYDCNFSIQQINDEIKSAYRQQIKIKQMTESLSLEVEWDQTGLEDYFREIKDVE